MNLIRRLGSWLSTFLGGSQQESELKEEFEFHLEMEIESNVRSGLSPAEARRKAMADFGGVDWNRERVREERGGAFLDDLLRDLRFGFRNLRKRPVFSLGAILTLSLGIGMTTTMFTLVDTVLLKPLPGSNTEGMVYLDRASENGEFSASPSPQLLRLLRDHATSFSRIEAYTAERFQLVLNDEPLRVRGAHASPGFFSFLGVSPALGRAFLPEDGSDSAAPVVLLNHSFWMERFGGDRNALGQTITIEGKIHQIVGVLPADFRVDNSFELLLWIPEGAAGVIPDEGTPVEGAIAKLAPGVSLETARAEMGAIFRNNPLDTYASYEFVGRVHTPAELLDPSLTRAILILQAAALLVLLIGCGNLANLLLAQGETRARELALRASLGATRGRLVRQLLVESLILGGLGGAGGVLFTLWATSILPIFLPPGIPALAPAGSIFVFASALSLFSVLVAGLLPAWKSSKRNLNEVIKGDSTQPPGRFRGIGTRQILVTAEVATAFVLLISAGLLIKSFSGLRSMDPGFETEGLLTVRVELPPDRYEEAEAQLAFFDRLREDLKEGIPPQLATTTVASGLVDNIALTFQPLSPEGTQGQDEVERLFLLTRGVDPDYFRTLGLPILQGRAFDEADTHGEEPVVIISESVARRYFPAGDAVGQRLLIGEDPYLVTGVSGTLQLPVLLREETGLLHLFFPLRAEPSDGLTVVARVVGDQGATLDLVKQIVRRIDPTIPIQKIALVDDLMADALSEERSNSLLMGLFALSALILGALGIYGVVAYSVSTRIREMGIRVALGASRQGVVAQVALGGMKTVLAGIVLGTVGALGVGTTLSRLLHEVNPRDPQIFLLVITVITGVALMASWLPARRAAGSEPLDSLKSE